MRKQSLIALFLALNLATISHGQQPAPTSAQTVPTPSQSATSTQPRAQDDDVVRITTNLVQVDAVVVDKDGKAVTDLKSDEVQIYEDNRPQKIIHFSYVVAETKDVPDKPRSAPAVREPGPPAAHLRPEDVRRTIAMVVDDLGLSFQSINYVRQALRKFVDQQMQPGDLVAIVRSSGGIGVLQQFTSDKRQLNAAIDHVKWYAGRSGISAFAPIEPPTPGRFGPDIDAANEDLNRFREDSFAVGTLGAVNYVVKGLRELPGRKSVLLISDGFRIRALRDRAQQINQPQRNDPISSDRPLDNLRQLIDQANRASVVIYTMNASGLQTTSLSAADALTSTSFNGTSNPADIEQRLSDRRDVAFETQEGLDYLARETGGIAIRNTNDLSAGIKRVMNDQKGYYLIAYRPDQSTFDIRTGRRRFHQLSLKVSRPGKFSIRTRNGFFGIPDEESRTTATPRDQILSALFSPFGAAGVHTQLTSLFANDAKLGSFIRSIVYVAASDLTFTDEPDGWHSATFDLVAVTFGVNGSVVDQINRTHQLRVRGDTYQNTLKDGFVYFVSFPVKKPGAYQLRTVLRDHGSERVGSAGQFVEIPDLRKDRLALSGLVVNGADARNFRTIANSVTRTNSQAAGQASPEPGNAQRMGNQSATQSEEGTETTDANANEAVRHFRQGMTMRYSFVIYNAQLDQVANSPQLQVQARLFRNGQVVFTGKVQPFVLNNPPDLKRLWAESAIRLGPDMVPGEYLLQVTVNDLLADEKHRTATQWMDFEITE